MPWWWMRAPNQVMQIYLFITPAAVASDGTDQCEMDEDDPKVSPQPPLMQTNSKMNSRRYRSSRADDE